MAIISAPAFRFVKNQKQGFTLIELIVVIAILGILFASLALIFNPSAQISKAQNATRQHDFEQIRTALDTYYDDTGCYPTTLNFAQRFSLNGKIYMTNIPEDPKCSSTGANCYVYQTDTSSTCPQWNVLYGTLVAPLASSATSCPLTSISGSCVPLNYQQIGTNYCVISGNVDCAKISSVAITPVPPGGSGGSSGSGGSGSSTPTPATCGTYYACTGVGVNGCNVLDSNSQQNCQQLGGTMACYCDSLCRVNGVSQCK